MKTPRLFVLHALENAKGDDLERALAAFRGATDAQMQFQYGESGRTCQEILDEYKAEAMAWLRAIK